MYKKLISKKIILFILCLSLILPFFLLSTTAKAAGQTVYIYQDITSDTTWSGENTYVICEGQGQSSPKVMPGVTLTIESGARVVLDANRTHIDGGLDTYTHGVLVVHGNINATGAIFTAAADKWQYIVLEAGSMDNPIVNASFTNCVFEKGGYTEPTGMIMIKENLLLEPKDGSKDGQTVNLNVSGCTFRDSWDNQTYGIKGMGIYSSIGHHTKAKGTFNFRDTNFSNLGGALFVERNGDDDIDVLVDNCTFDNVHGGIYVESGRHVTVTDSNFSNIGKTPGTVTPLEVGRQYNAGDKAVGNVIITGNTFTGTSTTNATPVRFHASTKINSGISDPGNTFPGYPDAVKYAYIYTGGYDNDAVWGNTGIPYLLDGFVQIGNTTGLLTIDPGVTVTMTQGGSIKVRTGLNATGTAERPIVFNAIAPKTESNFIDIYNCSKDITLKYCILDGMYYGIGGGMNYTDSIDSITIENCTFKNMTKTGLSFTDYGTIAAGKGVIKNSVFENNGEHGFYGVSAPNRLEFSNCIFRNNLKDGIYLQRVTHMKFDHCLIYSNGQNGVTLVDNIDEANAPSLVSCTIAKNGLYGVLNKKDYGYLPSYTKVYGINLNNTISSNNGIEDLYNQGYIDWSGANITYSCITTSWSDYNGTVSVIGIGSIRKDAIFADVDNNDFHLKSDGGRFNGTNWVIDTVASQCIDSGNPALSYENETAPNGSRINMGYYGNTNEASRARIHALDTDAPVWPEESELYANDITSSSAVLSWDAVEHAVKYRVFKNADYNWGEWAIFKTLEGTSCAITGDFDWGYFYKVEAMDEAGNWSSTGPERYVRTPDTIPPVWEDGGTLSATSTTSTSTSLNWSGAYDDRMYINFVKIYKNGVLLAQTSYYNSPYVVTGLTPDTEYTFKVEACDSSSNWTSDGPSVVVVTNSVECAKPKAPVTITAVSAGYNSIKIIWDTVENASGYEVWRCTTYNGLYGKVKDETSANIFINTDLASNTTYYYKVRAYLLNSGVTVYGDYSDITSAKPILLTPDITSIESVGYNCIKINWDEVNGATGYKIYRSTSSKGTYAYVTSVTSTSYTNTGLATGTTYYYKVLVYRTEGSVTTNSAYSAVKSAKPIPTTPIATAVSAGYNSVKVFWNIVPGATGYTVYRSDTEDGTYLSIPATITTTSYTQTSLAMGKTYYYKVRAYRTVGTTKVYGNYSEVTSAVPIPSTPVPTAVSTGYTSIKITWPAISGATGYKIYSTDENGENETPLDENLLTAYYNHTSLTTDQTYYYKVIALRTVGTVTTPSSESVIVSAKPVPSAPTGLSAVSAGYNSVNISWQEVMGAEGYMVSRAESSTGEYTNLYTTGDLNITDNNLTTGKTYYYKIRGIIYGSPTILGDYSAVVSVKPIPATPVITVTPTQYNSLSISWEAITGATGYKVYRSTSSKGTYTALTPTTSTSLISTGLATGTTYYYKVLAYTTEGSITTNSLYSAVKYAKVIPAAPVATAASYSYNSVKVSWGTVSGATGYELYYSTAETTGYKLLKSTTAKYYVQGSLITGNTYYYKVRAYRTVGTTKVYGNYSEVTSAAPIPSAPVPTAVSTGYTSIKITWPAISGATGYKIYSTDENGENETPLDENLLTAYYNHTSLTTNQTYYYKVIAFRTVNTVTTPSSDSVIVSAKPVPSAPTGLSAASAGYNSVNISWQEVPGAEGYALMRSASLNGLYEKINGGTFTSCADNGLTTGSPYYYKVYAYINGTPEIKGDDSVTVSVKPIPATPVITVTATQYNSLSISWDAVDAASGYKVYRSTSKTGTYAYVAPVTAGTSYINTGLATGTTYYYKVLAYRTEGTVTTNSLYSAYKYAKVIPSAPIATAASYNYNSVKISWPKVSGASGYTIYRCATETGTYAALVTTSLNSYTNTSLITGNTYYYKVIAYRTVGRTKVYSAYSAITSAKVIPSTPVVKADNYSYTSNIITWPIVSGATGYLVYLTDETGTDETVLSDNNANNKNSYIHTGLTTNQTYWYKVVAYRTVSAVTTQSADSAAVSSAPIPTAPVVSVLLNTYNSLNITWNPVAGADKYEIKRCDSSGGEFIKVGEAGPDATNYIDSSLTTSATYYYKVVALIEPDIYGDESAVVSAKVLPAAPVVTVTPTAYNSLSLSWNSQDGVTGYRIYRSTSKTGTYSLITTITDGSTSFVNAGLAAGATYNYKLIAYRTDGAVTTLSPYSVVKSAKVVPAAPTGVSAQSASYNSIKVTWNKVSGASGYTVYRATSETGTYTTLATITTNIYTSTGLATGTTYYYKVAAYRLAGTTKVYSAASDITSAYPKPSIPVPTAQSAGYTSVKITWPIALGASGYEIYQTDENGEITKTLDENVTAVTYTDTGLTTNQTYYYKVKSYKTTTSGKVYGDFSVVVNAIPIPSTPVIKVTLNSYNSLNINWEAIDGADKYEVWRNTASTGDFTKIGEIDTNSYLDSSLTTGATYYYQVRAYIEGTSNIYSNYSAAASLKVTPTTPIITVTPNTYNSLSISWEEVSGATGYMIYRATSSAGTYTRVYTAGAGETSYVNTGIATGSTYYYKVLAFVTEGTVTTNSAYSAVKSAKVKPAAPTGAAAASASYTSIKISWNAVSGASGYTVYRLASNGTYASIATVTGINSVTYTNTGLITGTTYTYKVAAYRLVGTTKVYGDYSEVVSAWPIASQ